ncbi:MAG TPA: hypothetical protein VII83_04475 [Gaiellaceae bacterium]
MSLATGLQIASTVAIALAAIALLLAVSSSGTRRVMIAFAAVTGALAVGSWVAVVLRTSHELVSSAVGTTGAFIAALGAIALAVGLKRTRQIDRELERGRALLRAELDKEVLSKVGELERIVARARADSSSQLAEQERALAETRRHAVAEAEQSLKEKLSQMLAKTQRDVEERVESWQRDLGVSETAISHEVSDLIRGVQGMVQETRARIEADGERISAESDEQRALIARLREEMSESIEQALAGNQDELEKFANERRRAIQDIVERLSRREREVMERIEREETEIQRRIQAGGVEIERKQLEQLQRFVERTASSVSDDHASQFDDAMKEAREDAQRRLRRELERAVEAYARRAQSALDERLRALSDESAGRIDARMKVALEEMRERAERSWAALEKRVADFELELRSRLQNLGSETTSARSSLESRRQQLHRDLDDLHGDSGSRG